MKIISTLWSEWKSLDIMKRRYIIQLIIAGGAGILSFVWPLAIAGIILIPLFLPYRKPRIVLANLLGYVGSLGMYGITLFLRLFAIAFFYDKYSPFIPSTFESIQATLIFFVLLNVVTYVKEQGKETKETLLLSATVE